jgi:DNA primase
MNGRISRGTLEELRFRTDIGDVVSEFVQLRKAGSSWKGLCPFHSEKTPSFFVSREKGVYHCFGCGEGGDSITFMMKFKNMDYREAVEELCGRYGVEVAYEGGGGDSSLIEGMFKMSEFAADYYHKKLFEGKNPALDYLLKRGLDEETIRELGLGFGGRNARGLGKAMKIAGFDMDGAVTCGLLFKGKRGDLVDRFAGRILFPVRNPSGKVAGFAGRALEGGGAKYMNSSESKIYQKKRLLYGLNRSRRYIREQGKVVVVEGYMDWIALWQAGIRNVVATCGTAITGAHFSLLKRMTQKIVLLFDGDPAGKKAAVRSVENAYSVGCSPLVLFPPSGLDPDDWVRKEGEELVRGEIDNALLLIDYVIEGASRRFDLTKPAHKLEYINVLRKYLRHVKDPLEMDIYVRKVATKLDLSFEEVKRSFSRELEVKRSMPGGRKGGGKVTLKPESILIGYLCRHPRFALDKDVMDTISSLSDPLLREIGRDISERVSETGEEVSSSMYIGDDSSESRVSEAIVSYERSFPEDREDNLGAILGLLLRLSKERELDEVRTEFRETKDGAKRDGLLRRQEELKREIERLVKTL